ncbi:hypothetical protein PR048_002504 [Dryococelus australis]|uniref:Uncharacterized protein n=1 Tax=Dryococelus australis TaxID=614101 RepID=A0ABQ9IMT1_9NEOP|nr:hypothetical protein PR048_002504 [Dryococelus australis]
MKGQRKQEIAEKTRRPMPSSGTIPTLRKSGVNCQGIEPVSPSWEESSRTAQSPKRFSAVKGTSHVRVILKSLVNYMNYGNLFTLILTPKADHHGATTDETHAIISSSWLVGGSRFNNIDLFHNMPRLMTSPRCPRPPNTCDGALWRAVPPRLTHAVTLPSFSKEDLSSALVTEYGNVVWYWNVRSLRSSSVSCQQEYAEFESPLRYGQGMLFGQLAVLVARAELLTHSKVWCATSATYVSHLTCYGLDSLFRMTTFLKTPLWYLPSCFLVQENRHIKLSIVQHHNTETLGASGFKLKQKVRNETKISGLEVQAAGRRAQTPPRSFGCVHFLFQYPPRISDCGSEAQAPSTAAEAYRATPFLYRPSTDLLPSPNIRTFASRCTSCCVVWGRGLRWVYKLSPTPSLHQSSLTRHGRCTCRALGLLAIQNSLTIRFALTLRDKTDLTSDSYSINNALLPELQYILSDTAFGARLTDAYIPNDRSQTDANFE